MKFLAIICMMAFLVHSGSAQKSVSKYDRSDLRKLPLPPDYTNLAFWAGHPDQQDAADLVPGKGEIQDRQSTARIDVFFVHPTIYSKDQDPDNPWNADVFDEELNYEVDQSTIRNQASVFNGSARVYAPRYRQAHINVWKIQDTLLKEKALDLAYQDVKAAFEYYLENENNDSPIIIAGHSQGTVHAARLLQDYFDGKPLQNRLVAAYIIGMPLRKELFSNISYCKGADETGCWINWNTYRRGHYPESFRQLYGQSLSVNPLNWKVDETYASRDENMGGVLKNYSRIIPRVTDAQNYQGILWVEKPHFFWRFLLWKKRYHIADYNLFYMNIRENVALRIEKYLDSYEEDVIGSHN